MTRDVARWQRLAHALHRRGVPLAPRLITLALRLVFGCYLPHTCSVGAGTRFGYGGLGTVVHGRAVIGRGCLVSQNVTIGGTSGERRVPALGDNVLVGAGAVILGPVTVGDRAVIAANAVVTRDVASETLVGGVPATLVRSDIDIDRYLALARPGEPGR